MDYHLSQQERIQIISEIAASDPRIESLAVGGAFGEYSGHLFEKLELFLLVDRSQTRALVHDLEQVASSFGEIVIATVVQEDKERDWYVYRAIYSDKTVSDFYVRPHEFLPLPRQLRHMQVLVEKTGVLTQKIDAEEFSTDLTGAFKEITESFWFYCEAACSCLFQDALWGAIQQLGQLQACLLHIVRFNANQVAWPMSPFDSFENELSVETTRQLRDACADYSKYSIWHAIQFVTSRFQEEAHKYAIDHLLSLYLAEEDRIYQMALEWLEQSKPSLRGNDFMT